MKRLSFVASLSVLLLFAGCGKKSNQAKVETINGIAYVHCPAAPSHPGKAVIFEEEVSFGNTGESEKVLLYQPSSYVVDAKGNAYVSDRSEQNIKVFDANGQYLKTIGAKGKGPGEFESIWRMAFLPDGRLLILDGAARRTSLFDAEGRFINSHQWRTSHYDIYFVSDSSYTADENVFGEKRRLYVKTFDLEGQELISYGEFTPRGMKLLTQGNMAFSISLPYAPRSVFAGDRERRWLYHFLNNKYVIDVYDQQGKLFRKIARPYDPVPFTDEDAEEYRSGFDDESNKIFAEMARKVEFPKVKTIAETMLVDELGNLWVETNEVKKEKGVKLIAYDIFNKDGFYEARVWSAIGPGLFAGGKMYRLDEDKKTGILTLKRYRILWKDID